MKKKIKKAPKHQQRKSNLAKATFPISVDTILFLVTGSGGSLSSITGDSFLSFIFDSISSFAIAGSGFSLSSIASSSSLFIVPVDAFWSNVFAGGLSSAIADRDFYYPLLLVLVLCPLFLTRFFCPLLPAVVFYLLLQVVVFSPLLLVVIFCLLFLVVVFLPCCW